MNKHVKESDIIPKPITVLVTLDQLRHGAEYPGGSVNSRKVMMRGGARLQLNSAPGMPAEKRKPAGVRHEVAASEDGVKVLTIHLPW